MGTRSPDIHTNVPSTGHSTTACNGIGIVDPLIFLLIAQDHNVDWIQTSSSTRCPYWLASVCMFGRTWCTSDSAGCLSHGPRLVGHEDGVKCG